MEIILARQFSLDIERLRKEDIKLTYKVWQLLFDIDKTPFDGIGKPEPLKGNMSGYWSRRIDEKHRLIYRINDTVIELVSAYGHYD